MTNWVETVGHDRGILQFRWQRLDRHPEPGEGPVAEVVAFDSIPELLPFHESNRITPDEWSLRIAARQSGVADRMLA